MTEVYPSFFWSFYCENTFQLYTHKRSMTETQASFFGVFAKEIHSNFIPIKEAWPKLMLLFYGGFC